MPNLLLKKLRIRPSPAPAGDAGGVVGAPTGLSAAPYGAARIDLSWTAVAGATSYVVERSPSGAGTWAAVTFPGAIRSNSWKDPSLSPATGYDYRVKAVAAVGTSDASAVVSATTAAAGSPPSRPIEFNAARFSSSAVNAGWSGGSGATYFVVERSLNSGSGWLPVAVVASSPYADAGLEPGTTYYYRVRAGKVGGEVADSDPAIAASTMTAGAPTLPTYHGLAAAPLSPTDVQVRWLPVQAPEGVEAAGYLVERSADGGSTWAQVASQPARTFVDTGRSASTPYSYRFRAVGAGGTSAPSSPVTITTLAARSGRSLLQPQDFTYLGSFLPPSAIDPPNDRRSSYSSSGIAMRRVGGAVRFFCTGSNVVGPPGALYEFAPPARIGSTYPYSQGTLVRYWGSPYGGKKLLFGGSTPAGSKCLVDRTSDGMNQSGGMFVDPANPNRIWITYQYSYNVSGSCDPSLLRLDLDDAAGTVAASGPWRFDPTTHPSQPKVHKAGGGAAAIPQWFADAHLNDGPNQGRPWGVAGFGGNAAGVASASFGLSLIAWPSAGIDSLACSPGQVGASGGTSNVASADLGLLAPVLPSRTLSARLYGGATGQAPNYGSCPPGRDSAAADYQHDTANAGHFYTSDAILGGGVWIDDDAGTRGKHGFLAAGVFCLGRSVYKGYNVIAGYPNGGPSSDGGSVQGLAIVDPAHLGEVADGIRPYDGVPVSPQCWWMPPHRNADLRIVPYLGNQGASQGAPITGAAFDAVTSRLYIALARDIAGESAPTVHVYQVAQ